MVEKAKNINKLNFVSGLTIDRESREVINKILDVLANQKLVVVDGEDPERRSF